MKKIIFALVACLMCVSVFAQKNGASATHYPSDIQKIATLKSKGRILMMNEQNRVPAAQFFQTYHEYLGISNAEDMVLIGESGQKEGNKTYRYQQHYMGVPVMGAVMLLHEKNGVVTYANGMIVSDFSRPFVALYAADEAVNQAILATGASSYAWENESLEQDLKVTKKDEKATYYPTPKLIFYDKELSSDAANYRLAYEVSVFALQPLQTVVYYIDATTGDCINVVKKNQNIEVEVQAKTRYNGTQTITVDSVAPTQFILRENSRGEGDGIYTRDLHHTGSLLVVDASAAVDVVEPDNFFDLDSVANNAHFGAEKTYDFYYEKFNRNSLDDNGMRLMSYVHLGTDVENACWTDGGMYYGDGVNGRPFTFLSVCGHEITHGLTENTANLVYQYESGALNEAFSDIFGSMIAFYGSDTLKWTIGDELGEAFRDMSNPNVYQNPDTYQGTYWVTDDSDNGGVHYNSGVANYWFYLLCQGGEGTNDHGTNYHVNGIGTDKATNIAYYTLTENLTETSDYQDTYELSLLVAADLYGECSPEVYEVAEAWRAVGVGYRYSDTIVYAEQILAPATGCALSNAEPVALEISYNSCDQPLPAGTEIQLRILVDNTTEIFDTLTLTSDMQPNDLLTLQLHSTVDVSALGQHHLSVFLKPDFAPNYTDSIINYTFNNLIYQNSDIHIVDLVSPVSSCFLTEATPIVCQVAFDICDSIAAGDSICIGYKLNSGDTIVEWLVLDHTVTSADTILYTFQTLADFTTTPRTTVRVYSLNPGDGDATDNVVNQLVVKPLPLNNLEDWRLTFDGLNMNNYFYTENGEFATLSIGTLSGYNDGKLVKMSGGNAMEYYNDIEFPEGDDWWGSNQKMDSRITFCADATDLAEFAIQFDLKQTSGADVYTQLLGSYIPGGVNMLQSSMMRVYVDDSVVSPNYIPATSSSDPFATRALNLCNYVGDLHSITFEAKCFAGDLYMFTLDHVYLDNITMLESNGIADISQGSFHLTAFPNPTTGMLNLHFDGEIQLEGAGYVIYDIMGKQMLSGSISNELTLLNISDLSDGIYILQAYSGNQLLGATKIVKN